MKKKIAFVLALTPTLPAPVLAEGDRLPGHRAVYELSFDTARTNSGIVGAEGRYVFDLEDTCEGYALNERLVVRISRTEDRVLTDYRLSAFEADDGMQYRFNTETEFDGRTGQEASGNLMLLGDGEGSRVDYASAEDLDFDEAVLAPVAHVREVLKTAQSGGDRHAATIFDGDIEAPIFYAVTRITAVEERRPETAEGAESLDNLERWRIDSVYYPPKSGTPAAGATPQFAFSATLFENGVVTDLTLDYMDFALKADLSALEIRDSDC